MKYQVLNVKSDEKKEITLVDHIFNQSVHVDILSRVIEWQLAKRRAGTHKTKTVSEISGTGKKMYRQKGTGGARHGSRRHAQFRGGATIFGPVVRSHEHSLPKKVRKLGLKMALASKFQSGNLFILNDNLHDILKTNQILSTFENLKIDNALIITAEAGMPITLAVRNLEKYNALPQIGANVYDIIAAKNLILTEGALEKLQERLQ